MTLCELALNKGLSRNYLHIVKKQNPEKFKDMMSRDTNKKKSLELYEIDILDTIDKMQELLLIQENRAKIGKLLRDKFNYLPNTKRDSQRTCCFELNVFKIRDNILSCSWNTIEKMRYIINYFEKEIK